MLGALSRPASPVTAGGAQLPRERFEYLVREAEELYWNELAWEELTEEERIGGGHLTELVFPGFLSFVDALLLESHGRETQTAPGSSPHPEVVEEVLLFLGERYARATHDLGQGADSENLVWARVMTSHLIDLVLYKLYRVSPEEREVLETVE